MKEQEWEEEREQEQMEVVITGIDIPFSEVFDFTAKVMFSILLFPVVLGVVGIIVMVIIAIINAMLGPSLP